ncbi:uncharacterized protein MYCFIDRAFT_178576 [Pseudocercospora fijiensis CIRAD86]|uniref:Uncharacterized protein n=1 Tax=Pseudocercospora fijiensis (strain CIRAD86) TaxID=383855 RepID=M2YL27_PSEFD|nr:uncharacterized protein MYCFIDRAFT_178576 [Pseudocercospora fijiensis CIRAD86]EME78440.1 hypothetical protein MYCFIDRAFT_178576 [Pseudocercospora fijiensis CIRAD86]
MTCHNMECRHLIIPNGGGRHASTHVVLALHSPPDYYPAFLLFCQSDCYCSLLCIWRMTDPSSPNQGPILVESRTYVTAPGTRRRKSVSELRLGLQSRSPTGTRSSSRSASTITRPLRVLPKHFVPLFLTLSFHCLPAPSHNHDSCYTFSDSILLDENNLIVSDRGILLAPRPWRRAVLRQSVLHRKTSHYYHDMDISTGLSRKCDWPPESNFRRISQELLDKAAPPAKLCLRSIVQPGAQLSLRRQDRPQPPESAFLFLALLFLQLLLTKILPNSF